MPPHGSNISAERQVLRRLSVGSLSRHIGLL